jgi:hypothetical protein
MLLHTAAALPLPPSHGEPRHRIASCSPVRFKLSLTSSLCAGPWPEPSLIAPPPSLTGTSRTVGELYPSRRRRASPCAGPCDLVGPSCLVPETSRWAHTQCPSISALHCPCQIEATCTLPCTGATPANTLVGPQSRRPGLLAHGLRGRFRADAARRAR